MQKPGIMKPALIVGIVSGVLLSVPYLRMVNCLCCIGMIVTGLAAGWMYSNACKAAGAAFTGADGAKIGLLSGFAAAVVSIVLTMILERFIGQPDVVAMNEAIYDWMQQNEGIPDEQLVEMEERIEAMRTGDISMGERIQGIVIGAVIGPIFSVLGGLMAGSLFKDKSAAPDDSSTPAA